MNDTLLFPANCGGPYDAEPHHKQSSYENMPTTPDEEAVIQYYERNCDLLLSKSILHVGIGNGSLYRSFSPHVSRFTGLTISAPEIDAFNHRFPGHGATLVVGNKHDFRILRRIGKDRIFDIIVDVNLKSFACCHQHFEDYIDFLAAALAPGGTVVTSERGALFGWPGNVRKAHTPGASTNPGAAAFRVLGVHGIKETASKYSLAARRLLVPNVQHRHGTPGRTIALSDEAIWFMEKAP